MTEEKLDAIAARYENIVSHVFYMEMEEAADFMEVDVPWLLVEVRRLKNENAAMRADLDAANGS